MRLSTLSIAPMCAVLVVGLSSGPVSAKTRAECLREYTANRDAIRSTGQTKRSYIASCRAVAAPGEGSPMAAPMAAPMTAPPPAPKPQTY
ncbi:MAG: hypothetical protein JO234_05945 [Hyphomicrobiales bacterium]|nr:hypothetical protein [Hyphomicrobiales bacterium]